MRRTVEIVHLSRPPSHAALLGLSFRIQTICFFPYLHLFFSLQLTINVKNDREKKYLVGLLLAVYLIHVGMEWPFSLIVTGRSIFSSSSMTFWHEKLHDFLVLSFYVFCIPNVSNQLNSLEFYTSKKCIHKCYKHFCKAAQLKAVRNSSIFAQWKIILTKYERYPYVVVFLLSGAL